MKILNLDLKVSMFRVSVERIESILYWSIADAQRSHIMFFTSQKSHVWIKEQRILYTNTLCRQVLAFRIPILPPHVHSSA